MRRLLTTGSLAGLCLAVLVLWAPLALAKTNHCLIINDAIDSSYKSLQAAQDAATAGDTLWVRGTCVGTSKITKDLTITGQKRNGFIGPTLDGHQQGHVLTIDAGVAVTINTLTITGGEVPPPIGPPFRVRGGGIYNSGTLTLNDTTISGNTAPGFGIIIANHLIWLDGCGGGIYNDGGTLILNGSTSIAGNHTDDGGGIYNSGTLTLNDSISISDNSAKEGGGISNHGTLTLNDGSSISGNTGPRGGGISNYGTVTLNDSSSITGNHSPSGASSLGAGGGIAISGGAVYMNDNTEISGNDAAFIGGGVYILGGGTSLTMTGNSKITGNTAPSGGGIYGITSTPLHNCIDGGNVHDNSVGNISFLYY